MVRFLYVNITFLCVLRVRSSGGGGGGSFRWIKVLPDTAVLSEGEWQQLELWSYCGISVPSVWQLSGSTSTTVKTTEYWLVCTHVIYSYMLWEGARNVRVVVSGRGRGGGGAHPSAGSAPPLDLLFSPSHPLAPCCGFTPRRRGGPSAHAAAASAALWAQQETQKGGKTHSLSHTHTTTHTLWHISVT